MGTLQSYTISTVDNVYCTSFNHESMYSYAPFVVSSRQTQKVFNELGKAAAKCLEAASRHGEVSTTPS
jgi:hypothetical protein